MHFYFTERETLKIYCLSHGYSKDIIHGFIEQLAEEFGLSEYLDKKTKKYSGGYLSMALALLHQPSIVYLDETSTGIDPITRRQLWNIISKMREFGASVVLTSHSMEECEALCTRIAIMVNGQFVCMGSTQHLKSKCAQGLVLQLTVKLDPSTINDTTVVLANENIEKVDENVQRVQEFVLQQFPQAVLR